MTNTRSPRQLVASYRETIAADPDRYDGDEDVLYWLVNDTPARSWTPSEAARAARISSSDAYRILRMLATEGAISSDERGAWTRYSAR